MGKLSVNYQLQKFFDFRLCFVQVLFCLGRDNQPTCPPTDLPTNQPTNPPTDLPTASLFCGRDNQPTTEVKTRNDKLKYLYTLLLTRIGINECALLFKQSSGCPNASPIQASFGFLCAVRHPNKS
jgi:hypothetical protein